MADVTIDAALEVSAAPELPIPGLAAVAKAGPNLPYSLGFKLGVREYVAFPRAGMGTPHFAGTALEVGVPAVAGAKFWGRSTAPLNITINQPAGHNRWVLADADHLLVAAWRPNEALRTANVQADLEVVSSPAVTGARHFFVEVNVEIEVGPDGVARTFYTAGAAFLPFFYAQAGDN